MTAATMTADEFYATFDGLLWDEQRIQFLLEAYEADYPFHLESQPDAVIQRFYHGTGLAMDVAQAFIKCFPAPLLCREATFRARKPVTLLDHFQEDMDAARSYLEFERIVSLLEAFSHLGIKNAEWCNPNELYSSYMDDPTFQNTSLEQGWGFEVLADSEPEEELEGDDEPGEESGSEEEDMYDSDDSDTGSLARIQPLPSYMF
jgi:hypothetical protein